MKRLLNFAERVLKHFRDFHIIWILLIVVLGIPLLYHLMGWKTVIWPFCLAVLLFFGYLIWKPLGAVHGLMGTSGSIRVLFFNFVLISFVFSGVYYLCFFKDAGITYDVNQPHIDYDMFVYSEKPESVLTKDTQDTLYFERQIDSANYIDTVINHSFEIIKYQRISFGYVFRNTILTTLMQDPGDLFTLASTYNQSMERDNTNFNKQRCKLFQWMLIVQVLISWIFFGVFIALLYDKFRHES